MELECRVCGNRNQNISFTAKNMRSAEMEPFLYFDCPKCHSISIGQIPENLGKYYENYYSFGPVGDFDSKLRKLTKRLCLNGYNTFSSRILNTPSDLGFLALSHCGITPSTKILDVGCGTGQMVFDLYEAGFTNVCGIDPFVDHNITHSNGSRVLKKSIFEEENLWDVIMLNHVFEHMDNPIEVLKRVRTLLTPNGLAMIRIPNASSYAYRKYKENWYGIQAPVHFFLPSIQGMHLIAQKAGMHIKEIKGENILEFWTHSIAYALNIWDYHELGMRTFLTKKSLKTPPPLIPKDQIKTLKKLNRHVKKNIELCDWSIYYLEK